MYHPDERSKPEMTVNCDMKSSPAITASEVSKVVWLLRNTITYGVTPYPNSLSPRL